MTHNDFDFDDDIIVPVMSFFEELGFNPLPTDSKPAINFRDELFVSPTF
jgi:hypothetical protein